MPGWVYLGLAMNLLNGSFFVYIFKVEINDNGLPFRVVVRIINYDLCGDLPPLKILMSN